MALCISGQALWASGILESLDDTTTPTGYVSSWLRNNLGGLNLMLGTEFSLSGDCIIPDMDMNISGIYTEKYFCFHFSKQANKNLGVQNFDWISIEGTDQGVIRKVSRMQTAQTYIQLSKECRANLDRLVEWFHGQQNTHASQVLYGDRWGGASYDLLPPPASYYNSCNFIWKY